MTWRRRISPNWSISSRPCWKRATPDPTSDTCLRAEVVVGRESPGVLTYDDVRSTPAPRVRRSVHESRPMERVAEHLSH